MTLSSLFSAALCVATAVAETSVRLNGWYPCSANSLTPDNTSAHSLPDISYYMNKSSSYAAVAEQTRLKQNSTMGIIPFECAMFRVPMCYDDVCKSDKTIDVFVKRAVATKTPDGQKGKALWLVSGGPGYSSADMEDLMCAMFAVFAEKVSVYTIDHRGAGRSARLECVATQAEGFGSPYGLDIGIDEMTACMDDIRFQVDNQPAAFSVTSAAKDLAAIIDFLHSNEDVHVYAASYGTYLVERLMHFAPKIVRGFILDGVVSESGKSSYSNSDLDTGVVGDRFLALCMADEFCKSKFLNVTDLAAFVHELYDKLDATVADGKSGLNACADAFAQNDSRPSEFLRSAFGNYLTVDPMRITIPAVIYRASRCTEQDAKALAHFAEAYNFLVNKAEPDKEIVLFRSVMLYYLIVFSEMWDYPTPNEATLINWYKASTMAPGLYRYLPHYCLFTGSREHACQELIRLPATRPLVYERDQYWNKTCRVPDGAAALIMTGGIDAQTLREYGEFEYEMMTGERMLLNFDNVGHCAVVSTPIDEDGMTCGMRILASFVNENGLLRNVNTSCMNNLAPLNFLDEAVDPHEVFGTDDLYENR